jgi:nitroreductase
MTGASAAMGLTATEIDRVLGVAQAAPSLDNSQPWAIQPVADYFEVRTDARLAAPVADPVGRHLHRGGTVQPAAGAARARTRPGHRTVPRPGPAGAGGPGVSAPRAGAQPGGVAAVGRGRVAAHLARSVQPGACPAAHPTGRSSRG